VHVRHAAGTGSLSRVDEIGVRVWFDDYREAFGRYGRAESDDIYALLKYYAVPLLVTTDDAARTLTTSRASFASR
jgi:hypothetical protein